MKGVSSTSFPMSIAVSAVVKPSGILLALMSCMYLGFASAGAVLAFALSGASSGWLPRTLFAAGAFCVAIAGILHAIRNRKSLHIDISGNGQIKVAEDDAWTPGQRDRQPAVRGDKVVASLQPNSTIWSFLLLLRLEKEDRTVRSWVILPDCTSAESFRALSVAIRWIAAHNDRAERKIL